MDLDEVDFQFLRKMLVQRAGVLIPRDQPSYVVLRLDPVVEDNDLSGLAELCELLRELGVDSSLGQKVIEALLRTETFFFRNYSSFDFIRHHAMPALIARNRDDRNIRIWCAACSSGQEAYSLAVLIREVLPEIANWNVTILGTDLSSTLIEQARTGVYSQSEMDHGLPRSIGLRNFKQIGKKWVIREEHRKAVEFQTFNLMGSWDKLPEFDIILMRNVLVYFQASARSLVVDRMVEHMHADSYVFLGENEELDKNQFFRVQETQAQVYQRKRRITLGEKRAFEFDLPCGEDTLVDGERFFIEDTEQEIRRLRFMKGVELSIAGPEFKQLSQIANDTYLFKGMSMEEIEKACRQIGLYQYEDSQVIIEQGQTGENFYIIYEGAARVLVSKGVFRKKEQVAVLRSGDLFGEMSLILEQPCNATVVAKGAVKVFVGKKGVFEYLFRESETFAATITKLIEERGVKDEPSQNEAEVEKDQPQESTPAPTEAVSYSSRSLRSLSITKEDGAMLLTLLRNNYLFKNLSVSDLDRICTEVQLHEYPPGDILLKQGYLGEGFFILYKGVVQVIVSPSASDDYRTHGTEVARLKSKEIFGEMSMILEEPCNATIVAKDSVQAFVINARLFRHLMESNKIFSDNINAIVIERVTDNAVKESDE